MGGLLSAPVELVRIQRRGTAGFRCGVADMQGYRQDHEDAHEIVCWDKDGVFFVLDGHGGDAAARFGAPLLAKAFADLLTSGDQLPTDEQIDDSFLSTDAALRLKFESDATQESGSTVIGAVVKVRDDGNYDVRILNAGDSRAIVFEGTAEDSAQLSSGVIRRLPEHLQKLAEDPENISSGHTRGETRLSPIIEETIDHKPRHPTEKARIEAAGGYVTLDEPPRLDGNLAVSRGIGDFAYKSENLERAQDQKSSCIPDVYDVLGVAPGSFLVLACDGVWDVFSGHEVANIVRDKFADDPEADPGYVAAEVVQQSLAKNSRDNITVMIVQFVDGSEWESTPQVDEMMGYEKLLKESIEDDGVQKQYQEFLKMMGFPPMPQACDQCKKWKKEMHCCPCKMKYYCTKACQKKGWKSHKAECSCRTGCCFHATSPAVSTGKRQRRKGIEK